MIRQMMRTLLSAITLPVVMILFTLLCSMASVAQLTTLHHFANPSNGRTPSGSLLADKYGNLYGTTRYGGTSDDGTVFELSPPAIGGAWTETVLYRFADRNDGRSPLGTLVADEAGNLYGATNYGGSSAEWGTVFELSPPATGGGSWTEQILYRFQGAPDGHYATSGVIRDAAGNLYGETQSGGSCTTFGGSGVVYKLSPPSTSDGSWTEQVLYSFQQDCGGTDGHIPTGGLVLGEDGSIIGATEFGGTSNDGVVFRLIPPAAGQTQWAEETLHNFTAGTDGYNPFAGLVRDAKGNVFGTTDGGGQKEQCCGTVYELLPPAVAGDPWTETILYAFTGGSDGASPNGLLVLDKSGNLYGTTTNGGTGVCGGTQVGGCGVVFKLAPPAAGKDTWTETVLHTFTLAISDEGWPLYGLTFGKNGRLYGTTDGWGTNPRESGTVFKIVP